MRKILFLFFMIISVVGYSQPTNYVWYKSRTRQYAFMADSGMHIPTYISTPTIRNGIWTGPGNIGIDTTNNKFYFYSGGAWREAGSTNYADSLRRVGLNVQMRKNGSWTTQFNLPDSTKQLTVGDLGGYGESADGATIYNDTLFMQLFSSESPGLTPAGGDAAKADTADMLSIDTTGVQDGDVATWDAANDKVVFAAPTGGGSTDSTWHINFKTEVTPGAPNGGDSTFVHPYFEGKVLDIYRDGVRQSILSNQYSITINSLVFHPHLDSAEVVEIVIKDSTRHRWITLNEVISEQDIEIDSYQGTLTESPDNQWNFSSNTKFAATATKMTGDGYVKLQTTGQSIIVSLDATTDLEAHTYPFLFNYAFWVNSGVLWAAYLDLQNPPAGIDLGSTNGMTHFKLIRLSGEVKLYGSTDGVTFNLLYTYPNTYNGDLYFKGINVVGGTGVIINPKSYGFE